MMTKTSLKIHCGKIDPVPLVDLFFLLVIFSLIGSSLVFHPGIQVQLPHAPSTELLGVPKIVVTITRPQRTPSPPGMASEARNGAEPTGETLTTEAKELLFFNDNRVAWADLEQRLRQEVYDRRLAMGRTATEDEKLSGHRGAPLLVLQADAGVAYERIVQVMALGRSLGLGVYLVTDPGGSRTPPPRPSGAPATVLEP